MNTRTFDSHWNKVLVAQRAAMRALGLARIDTFAFPVAFAKDDVRVDAGVVNMTVTATLKASTRLDVVEFFMSLWRAGRLPLATDDDVRRFVACLAAPLIREVAQGLLGIFWFIGPPGAGKDFLAELASDIYKAATMDVVSKVKFDLSGTDDLEMKRSMAAAGTALYARAKEAGKRGGDYVDLLIRLAGTDQVAARAMRENEIEVPMRYVVVADSAEDVPDRKEVSRRTVVIRLKRIDADDFGDVRRFILEHAADIVYSLKVLVEAQGAAYFQIQAGTKGRPVGQVALTRLFNVVLEEPKGRDLSEIWEGLEWYVSRKEGRDEGHANANKRAGDEKLGEEIRRGLSHFSLSTALSRLREPGSPYRGIFDNYKSGGGIAALIKREAEYDRVGPGGLPYLPVVINRTNYAFKLLRDGRFFILMPELEFTTKMDISAVPLAGNESPPLAPAASEGGDRLAASSGPATDGAEALGGSCNGPTAEVDSSSGSGRLEGIRQ